MRYRLRTLLILLTAVCVSLGWYAYLRRMAGYHRVEATAEFTAALELAQKHGSKDFSLLLDDPSWSRHSQSASEHWSRAHDFDYALLRPWLAFVHCKRGTTFGAPPAESLLREDF